MTTSLTQRLRRWPWRRICRLALLLLAVVLGGRLLWIAARTETGYQTLMQHWRDATVGLVAGEYVELQYRDPAQQAEFWLAEVERIVSQHPDDAEIAMGAALVLDRPGANFLAIYWDKDDQPFDRMRLIEGEQAYERKCRDRCLQLAERATRLEPENPQWWQMRAMLLWGRTSGSSAGIPREPNWSETLDQCSLHDPANALYDFLAAEYLWESSAEQDYSAATDALFITVHEPALFQQGSRRFEQGLTKKYFGINGSGNQAAVELLGHSHLPFEEQPAWATSRAIESQFALLMRNLVRWTCTRASQDAKAGNVEEARKLYSESHQLLEQYASSSRTAYSDLMAAILRSHTAAQMNQLAHDHPGKFSDEEKQKFFEADRLAHIESSVHTTAWKNPGWNTRFSRWLRIVSPSQLLSMAVVLLAAGSLFGFASRYFTGDRRCAVPGVAWQAVSFALAVGMSFTLFSLAPAEIISPARQQWLLPMGLCVLVLFIGLLAFLTLSRNSFRFSLRSLLILQGLLLVACMIVIWSRSFSLTVPERGWQGIDASYWKSQYFFQQPWQWAVAQWSAYQAYLIAVGVWLALLIACFELRLRIAHLLRPAVSYTLREQAEALLRTLSRPAFWLAAILLLLYLALAPLHVQDVEQEVDRQMSFVQPPEVDREKFAVAIQAVREDQGLMLRFETEALANMAAEANR